VSKTKAALSETVDAIFFLASGKIDPVDPEGSGDSAPLADLGVKPTREISRCGARKDGPQCACQCSATSSTKSSRISSHLEGRGEAGCGDRQRDFLLHRTAAARACIFIVGVTAQAKPPASGNLPTGCARKAQRGARRRGQVFGAGCRRATGNLGTAQRHRDHQAEVRRRSGGGCLIRTGRCQGALLRRVIVDTAGRLHTQNQTSRPNSKK